MIGENLAGEAAPFYFVLKSGIDIRPAPHVFVPDLVCKIFQVLEQNGRYMYVHVHVRSYRHLHMSMLYMYITECNTLPMALKTNRLTWHDGVIPPDEIWVKIGGDKGGNSMKTSSITQCFKTQLRANTCIFSVFEAKDISTNLHVALDRYEDQIKHLQSTLWRYHLHT